MPAYPRVIGTTPEERTAIRIRDLQKRVGYLERSNALGIQRYSNHPADKLLSSTPVTLDTVTLNIPDTHSRILVWWRVTCQNGSAGTTCLVTIADEIDFVTASGTQFVCASHTGVTAASYYSNQAGITYANGQLYETPNARMMYGDPLLGYPSEPTPGDHTFTLTGVRTLGASTTSYSAIYWWIAVI